MGSSDCGTALSVSSDSASCSEGSVEDVGDGGCRSVRTEARGEYSDHTNFTIVELFGGRARRDIDLRDRENSVRGEKNEGVPQGDRQHRLRCGSRLVFAPHEHMPT